MPSSQTDPADLLGRFGLDSFRSGQDEVVESVLRGEDVLCVMPTGGGKSLCYQLPSLALEGTTIVVSPLIALMKDQVDSLLARGIRAGLVNSSLSIVQQNEAMDCLAAGEFDLVYVAPERLRNTRFLESLKSAKIALLAVDEAHCISEWGHDFRPDYARLGIFRKRYLGDVQTIALTATATPAVREDITRLLELRTPRMFITGFARTNLRFQVQQCKGDREKDQWLKDYLTNQKGSGIIYAATRKRCEEIAAWLPESLRRPIGVYHAGLDPNQRKAVQEQFMAGRLSAIVATNAFGMGIDKSDLRYVIHYNMPGTLEAYYQEAGRAGRDLLNSECTLLFSYSDRHVQEFFIENRYPTRELVQKVYDYLLSREEDPIELTLNEVRDRVQKDASAEAIGTAESLLARAGVLKRLDSSSNHAVIRIDSDLPTLVDLLPREAKQRRKVLRAVEKLVGEHRFEDVYMRPQKLCEIADINRDQLARVLRELNGLKAFDYVPPFRGRAVHFLRRDLAFADLKIDFDELERRKLAEYEKLDAVIAFARTARCRQREILDYFGDRGGGKCDACDRCKPQGSRQWLACHEKTENISLGIHDEAALVKADAIKPLALDPLVIKGIRVILSGVARTHGRFGKGIVAQMLCGSQNKKIQQWKLNRLSTYGMLEPLKQTQVSEVIDVLIGSGLIQQVEVEQRRPTIQLSDFGKEVMMGREEVPQSVQLPFPLARQLGRVASRLEKADIGPSGSEATAPPQGATKGTEQDRIVSASLATAFEKFPLDDLSSVEHGSGRNGLNDEPLEKPTSLEKGGQIELDNRTQFSDLLGRLKRWRTRLSAASGIPAFRVLTNATLERIAERIPTSLAELENIEGLGQESLQEYGFDLVELVSAFLAAVPEDRESGTGNEFKRDAPEEPSTNKTIETSENTRGYWTWRLLSDGYSVEEVLVIRRIDVVTMLEDLLFQGGHGRPIQGSWHVGMLRLDAGRTVAGPLAPRWKDLERLLARESSRG